MRFGLGTRILIAGGVVLAFLVLEFVLVLRALDSTRTAINAERRARESANAATTIEKLVLDLESGSRGYVITHDPSFLAPWRAAKAQLPAASHALLQADSNNPAMAIDAAWQNYLGVWSDPLVALARTHPAAARTRYQQGRAKHQVDEIRGLIDPYVARQLATANTERAKVSHDEHVGVVTAVTGIGITALLFFGVVAYFLRAAVVPVRRLADATDRVASGDLDVVVPEEGAGEVGQLAAAFNTMARSLERQRASLAEQNADLERLANVLRAVLDSTVDGILLSDSHGNVQLANRPLVEMTRELGMQFEGSVVDRLLSVAPRMKDPQAFRETMESLRANPSESTFNEFEEAETGRVFQGWTSIVRGDHDAFIGRIWTMREVTQQRELDRMKDEFVATVSHELRTPLTSMMGFLQMICEGEAGALTPEQERFLAIVYRSSERLQRLVGDLLFVSRLDASGIQLQLDRVRLDRIAQEAVESVAGLAQSRELTLEHDLQEVPEVPAVRERLAQLFGNLLSNALKFTPAGGTVTTRTFSENGVVVGEVEDMGIGIPENEQERLFQRFFRSTTAAAQAIPGTGLGLVISKAIAEAHGGTIRVRSTSGVGTCFRFELPIEREESV